MSGAIFQVTAPPKTKRVSLQHTNKKQKMTIKHELNVPYNKATFGMGCFWSGDCVYGVIPGVLRTRVGYAGGKASSPSYRNIGDHTEVIEVHFDPMAVSYAQLLKTFWHHHEYGLTTKIKRQYMSLILCHDDEQKIIAVQSMADEAAKRNTKLVTEIQMAEKFYPAEDYHQKYKLQRHTYLMDVLGLNKQLLQTSHVAARLNGFVMGLGGMEQFEAELEDLGLDEKTADYVRAQLIKNEGGMLSC